MFRFISLGGDCQTAAQIAGLKPITMYHFFDMISIPIDQAIRLIENDFRDMLIPENLHPCYIEENLGRVIDTYYRIDIGHDFRDFSAADIASVRKRFALRARWFRDLFHPDRTAPYFVRRWHPRDGEDDERLPIRLFELLRAKRPDIRMLYLHKNPERAPVIAGAYRSHYLAPPERPQWIGNTEAWRYVLHDFAVREPAGRPATAVIKTVPRWGQGRPAVPVETLQVETPPIETLQVETPAVETGRAAVAEPRLRVMPHWSRPAPEALPHGQIAEATRLPERRLPVWRQPMQGRPADSPAANDGDAPIAKRPPSFG